MATVIGNMVEGVVECRPQCGVLGDKGLINSALGLCGAQEWETKVRALKDSVVNDAGKNGTRSVERNETVRKKDRRKGRVVSDASRNGTRGAERNEMVQKINRLKGSGESDSARNGTRGAGWRENHLKNDR